MAVDGTKIPNDAGKQNVISSVPRPDQKSGHSEFDSAGTGFAEPQSAADNATDLPRRNQDTGVTGEVVTGTGDQLPAEVETKRLHVGASNPAAKGHDRVEKHATSQSGVDRLAGEGVEVDAVPGEEEDSQDTIREKKGL